MLIEIFGEFYKINGVSFLQKKCSTRLLLRIGKILQNDAKNETKIVFQSIMTPILEKISKIVYKLGDKMGR